MSQTNEKAVPKTEKKKRPLRKAQHWGSEAPRMAFKLLGLMLAIVVMGLIFSALQAIEMVWLRAVLSLAIASGMLLLCYNEGITKGVQDVRASRLYVELAEKGHTPVKKDDAACYHPLKAVLACVLMFALPLAAAVYIALTTKGYTYTLQDLPVWLTDSYGTRADVMGPLGAYGVQKGITTMDWLRMFARLPVMIYINLFADPLIMTALVDRVAPLLLLTYPAAYLAGYLLAPRAGRRIEKMNRRAKKIAVRKAQRSSLAKELVGDQHGVHYGHAANKNKHKKKELV